MYSVNLFLLFALLASNVLGEDKSAIVDKKQDKRGLLHSLGGSYGGGHSIGLGINHGGLTGGHGWNPILHEGLLGHGSYNNLGGYGGGLGGYSLGSGLGAINGLDGGVLGGLVGSGIGPSPIRVNTISQAVPVPVPQPVPVPVNRPYPVPVPHPVPVAVPRPVAVPVPQPYPVPINRPYPVPIEKPYPVRVPHPVPVPVPQAVPVSIPQPYPVTVPRPVPLSVSQPIVVTRPIAASPLGAGLIGPGIGGLNSFGGHIGSDYIHELSTLNHARRLGASIHGESLYGGSSLHSNLPHNLGHVHTSNYKPYH